MKRLQVKVEAIYAVEVPDDYNFKDDDYTAIISEHLESQNTTAQNEFYEHMEVICSDCGISLLLDDEQEDGKCAQCNAVEDEL